MQAAKHFIQLSPTQDLDDVGIDLPNKESHCSRRSKRPRRNVLWHESNLTTQETYCVLQRLSYEGRGDGQGALAHTHVDLREGGRNWSVVSLQMTHPPCHRFDDTNYRVSTEAHLQNLILCSFFCVVNISMTARVR